MKIAQTYDYLVRARRDLWAALESVPDEVLSRPLLGGSELHCIKDLLFHVASVEDGWIHEDILRESPLLQTTPALKDTQGGPACADFAIGTLLGYWKAVEQSTIVHLSPRSVIIERANLKHINRYFGKMLLCDVAADDIACYQAKRLEQGAAPKTINLEVGTLRAILRKNRLWALIQPDVRMLRVREDVGRAISREEETALLEACRASRSRSLFPAVLIALNTCMRYSELRLLQWGQVDLNSCTLTVGNSKTEAGTGRLLPLNDRAVAIFGFWASLFPLRDPNHFVCPAERYGASGDGATVIYESDPTKPIGRWKEAWESAKTRAGVSCRFHDLRHTGCTRMLEAGVPFSAVATIMGWSPSTTVRMSRRYGHIGQSAQRHAVNALKAAGVQEDGTQNWAQSQARPLRQLAN